MICKVCGTENEVGSKFCFSCGAILAEASEGKDQPIEKAETNERKDWSAVETGVARGSSQPFDEKPSVQEINELTAPPAPPFNSPKMTDVKGNEVGSPVSSVSGRNEADAGGNGTYTRGLYDQEVPLAMNPPLEEGNVSESFSKIWNGFLHFLQMFWGFLARAFKHPERAPFFEEKKAWVNGLILLLLFSFFAPLMTFTGNQYLPEDANFWTEVMKPFILNLLFFAAAYGLFYFFYMMGGIRTDGLMLLARFGSLMVLPTALLILSLFGLLIDPWLRMQMMVISWKLVYVTIPFMYRPLRREEGKGIDAFYATLITITVLVFIDVLLNDILNKPDIPQIKVDPTSTL